MLLIEGLRQEGYAIFRWVTSRSDGAQNKGMHWIYKHLAPGGA